MKFPKKPAKLSKMSSINRYRLTATGFNKKTELMIVHVDLSQRQKEEPKGETL